MVYMVGVIEPSPYGGGLIMQLRQNIIEQMVQDNTDTHTDGTCLCFNIIIIFYMLQIIEPEVAFTALYVVMWQ